MSEVMLDIKQWGNNLGVRLPLAIAREARLQAHQRVKIEVINEQIVISPVIEKALSLEERLALFDPQKHGGEVMTTTQRLGAEQW
jgi:antitoxin MazE